MLLHVEREPGVARYYVVLSGSGSVTLKVRGRFRVSAERSPLVLDMLRSSMKLSLMVVCAFVVPLIMAKFSRDQDSYALSLLLPLLLPPEEDNNVKCQGRGT